MKKLFCLVLSLVLLGALSGCRDLIFSSGPADEMPVIYLYPEEETEVTVRLDYQGALTCTYPALSEEGTWTVTAAPDGTLTGGDGREYYCLFWEGTSHWDYDFSEGFCVTGQDTAAFLEEALADLGLTEQEANEFLLYWLPRMEGNPYNLIAFQTQCYTDTARLGIDPAPDTLIRVHMAWKGLSAPVELPPQELTAVERIGFTAVEWGGTEVS